MAAATSDEPGVPVEVQIDTLWVELVAFRQAQQTFVTGILEDKQLGVADTRNTELQIKALEELVKESHDANKRQDEEIGEIREQ